MSIENQTKVKIVSDALVMLGEKPLSSLSDDRHGAVVGSARFEVVYQQMLSSHLWRFAIYKVALSQDASDPLNEWAYAYERPAEALNIVRVYPDSDYEIYGDKIFSNHSSLECDYLGKPAITKLPSYFTELLVARLAMEMARSVAGSNTTWQETRDHYAVTRAEAMWADSQARPNRPLVDAPLVDVR